MREECVLACADIGTHRCRCAYPADARGKIGRPCCVSRRACKAQACPCTIKVSITASLLRLVSGETCVVSGEVTRISAPLNGVRFANFAASGRGRWIINYMRLWTNTHFGECHFCGPHDSPKQGLSCRLPSYAITFCSPYVTHSLTWSLWAWTGLSRIRSIFPPP